MWFPESDNAHYQAFRQAFKEQYKILNDNKIKINHGKEITAKSIQQPYDTECDFRIKTGKKTKGYNHNITETCDSENVVNLITDVQTAPATQADNEFLEPSIKKKPKNFNR